MARPALAATRAVSILNYLASRAPEQFTLSDLARDLDINLASTHALTSALEDSGYVVRHPRLRTYGLGPSVVALGSAALECHPAIDHAREEARRLSEDLGIGVAVTALAGSDIVFLSRIGDHSARDVEAFVGQRIPLRPPVGAVFMAWSDPAHWLEGADDPALMRAVLGQVRNRGWAASLEGQPYEVLGTLDPAVAYDVLMIAAPVFNQAGEAMVSLTLLGLPPALSAEKVKYYGDAIRDAGLIATRRSGGRPPSPPFDPSD